jgi:hypothetical protein
LQVDIGEIHFVQVRAREIRAGEVCANACLVTAHKLRVCIKDFRQPPSFVPDSIRGS